MSQDGESGYRSKLKSIKTTHGSYVLYEAEHRLRSRFLDFYRENLNLTSDEKTGKFECPICKRESTRAGGRVSDHYFTCTINNDSGSGRCEVDGCDYFFSSLIDWWSKFSDDVDYSKFKHETLEEIVIASNLDLRKFSKLVAPRLGAGWDGDVLKNKHYAESSKNMGSDDPQDVVEKGNAAIRKLTGRYQDWYAHAFGLKLAPNGKMVCPNEGSHPKKSDSVTLELDRNTGNARCTVCDMRFSPQRLWHRYAQFTIAFNSYVRLDGSYRAYVLEIIDKMKEAVPDESLSASDTDNPVQFDAPSKDTPASKSSQKSSEAKKVYVINGDEAFMDEEQRKIMFATVYNILNNGFHEFYKSDFGLKQAANKNFHCFNSNAHKHGDKQASLSINNANGLGNCKTCGISFNLISLFTEYGLMTSAASYHVRFEGKVTRYLMHRFNLMPKDTVMDFTGAAQILDQMNMSGSDCMSGEDLKNMVSKMKSDPSMIDNRDVSNFVESAKKMSIEEGYAIDPYATHVMDEKSSLTPLIEALHKDQDSLAYLESTRGISADVLRVLKIGLYRNGAFAIPLFTEDGRLINIKKYHPRNVDRRFKWAYQEQGKPAMAFPYAALSQSKIYIVEGETDVICMYAHGFEAVTFGASVNTNMVRILNGAKNVERFFKDKEVFIIPDRDAAGEKFASSMSNAIREYAKQIKIVDLDVSGADWTSLDPSKKNADGKRIEKDVTDFLKKNGFGNTGKSALESLISKLDAEKTPDATLSGIVNYNVSLGESSKTKYMDSQTLIVIHTSGIISAVDQKSTIPSEIVGNCPVDEAGFKKLPQCHNCAMACARSCASGGKVFKAMTAYEEQELKRQQDQGITPEDAPKMTDNVFRMDDHEQLNMINEVDQKKIPQMVKAAGINRSCPHLIVKIKRNINVSCTTLSNDFSNPLEKIRFGSNATDTMKAYIKTHETLEVGRPYKIKGVSTTNVNGVPSLMIYDLKSKKPMNAYFEMTDAVNSMISNFKKPDGVSVMQHMMSIGKMVNDEAGVTGRDLAALMGVLTVLSPNVLPFEELLPGINRGQMQGLVMGDTRCAKSLIIKKIFELFCEGRVEYLGCNSSTSRTGLIGSITSSGGEIKIEWGIIPKTNGGIVVLDESHQLDPKVLTDMNNIRSEGIAEITKSKQGIAEARVQMIFIANERPDSQGNVIEFSHKLDSIFHYAGGDKTVISRFDWVIYMESDDVKVFNSVYDPRPSWFNKNSCKALRAWTQSIKEWDMDRKEIHERIQYWFNYFRDKYDFSSVLINQEMRAKLARLVCAIAVLCGERSKHNLSVPRITIEHVDAAAELYELLYSGEKVHTNLNLKKYADMNRTGVNVNDIDIEQLKSLLYFCDVKSMIRSNDITVSQIDVAFAHYSQLVERGLAYIPSEKGGKGLRTTEVRSYSVAKVIMGYLLNCGLVVHISGVKYRKTKEFSRILIGLMENSAKPIEQQEILKPDALMVNKLLSADDFIKKVNGSDMVELKSIGTIQKNGANQVVVAASANVNQTSDNVSPKADAGEKSTSSKLTEARRRLLGRRQP